MLIFNPFRVLIFNPFRTIFSKSPIFIQTARILPKDPFRTSIFPKSPIFNPKALFLSKINSEYELSFRAPFSTQMPLFYSSNPLRMSIFPLNPIFNPDTSFLPKNPFRTSIFHKCLTQPPILDPTFPSAPQIFPKASF